MGVGEEGDGSGREERKGRHGKEEKRVRERGG